MDQLVTTDWLADQLHPETGLDDLVVLDCTVFLTMGADGYVAESGRSNFEARHIPGASFADLTAELADTDSPNRFAPPPPAEFAAAMERLGVADGRRVVLYDDNASMWAARVWFMLRCIGFDDAAILDGGLKAWEAEGLPLAGGVSAPSPASPSSLSVSPRPELVADKADVLAAIDDDAVCLIDALPGAVFRGDVAPYGRPGHIPGALNVAANSLIDHETGRFVSLDKARAMLPDRHEARTVAY